MTKFIPTNVFYIINIIKLDSKEYSFIRKNNNYLPVLSVVLEQRRVIPELTVGKITITLIAYLPWAGIVLSTLHRLAYNPHHGLLRRFCEDEETEAREAHLPISGGAPLSLNHSAVGWSPQVPSQRTLCSDLGWQSSGRCFKHKPKEANSCLLFLPCAASFKTNNNSPRRLLGPVRLGELNYIT